MKRFVLALLLLSLCAMAACSSGGDEAERLTALEAEVQTLRAEASAREKSLREELAQIRMNLEGIQGLLAIDKNRADALQTPGADAPNGADSGDKTEPETGRTLDDKAKSFVNENLDRLLAITKRLLDNMERQLDEQMKEPETPEAQKGDEI